MKKLKLNLDEIKVESFEVPIEVLQKGTINGALDHCDSNGSSCAEETTCNTGGGGGTSGWPNTLYPNPCYTVNATCPGNFSFGETCPPNYTCLGSCPGQYTCYGTGICVC